VTNNDLAQTEISARDTSTIQQILQVWFNDESSNSNDVPQLKRWFTGGKSLDEQLSAQFSSLLEQMLAGQHTHWQASSEGALASILVLDQFSRNIKRGTRDAFSGDAQALGITHHTLEQGFYQDHPITHQAFFFMPLVHDESLESQRLAIELINAMRSYAPSHLTQFAQGTLDSALEHQQIIERFGRYPHRNKVLDRTSTAEELAWLAAKGNRFGQ